MEILGIGMSELVFIVIIALIVLGPKDMQKAGRTIARWINQFIQSDIWKGFRKTSEELRKIQTNLMREANLEIMRTDEEIRKSIGTHRILPTSEQISGQTPPRENTPIIKTPPARPENNQDEDA